jgi:hypothetical protein
MFLATVFGRASVHKMYCSLNVNVKVGRDNKEAIDVDTTEPFPNIACKRMIFIRLRSMTWRAIPRTHLEPLSQYGP